MEGDPQNDLDPAGGEDGPEWHRRVVGRSLHGATRRSIDRGERFVRVAAKVLERTNGESLTVQEVADEAGQSLRTLYQYFASKEDLLLAVFEEAMRTYATILRAAVADLDDPVERLAGGVIASARISTLHGRAGNAGMDRGLSHLRLQLGQAEPAQVARSQAPVTSLFRELVADALATSPDAEVGEEAATYFVSSMRTSFVISMTLGNEYAVELPGVVDLSCFCLGGLGLHRPRAWHEKVDARLGLTEGDSGSILRRLARDPGRTRG